MVTNVSEESAASVFSLRTKTFIKMFIKFDFPPDTVFKEATSYSHPVFHKIHFSIISHLQLGLLSSHFPWDVANKVMCQFLMNLKTATCQAHLTLFNYIYLRVLPSANYEYCNNSVTRTMPTPVAERCKA